MDTKLSMFIRNDSKKVEASVTEKKPKVDESAVET